MLRKKFFIIIFFIFNVDVLSAAFQPYSFDLTSRMYHMLDGTPEKFYYREQKIFSKSNYREITIKGRTESKSLEDFLRGDGYLIIRKAGTSYVADSYLMQADGVMKSTKDFYTLPTSSYKLNSLLKYGKLLVDGLPGVYKAECRDNCLYLIGDKTKQITVKGLPAEETITSFFQERSQPSQSPAARRSSRSKALATTYLQKGYFIIASPEQTKSTFTAYAYWQQIESGLLKPTDELRAALAEELRAREAAEQDAQAEQAQRAEQAVQQTIAAHALPAQTANTTLSLPIEKLLLFVLAANLLKLGTTMTSGDDIWLDFLGFNFIALSLVWLTYTMVNSMPVTLTRPSL